MWGSPLVLLFLLLPLCAADSSASNSSDPEQELNRLLGSYIRHQRPHSSGEPVVVRVNMFINSFSSVSMVDMDYTVDFMLRQRWRDERLNVTGSDFETLSLGYMKERLWIPDLFFRNAKVGQLHTLTTPNYLIWLRPGGEILFSQKLTVKFSCAMRLWNFPMDTQRCRLEMGSYGYSMQDLVLDWWGHNTTDHVTLSSTLHLNEFSTPRQSTGSCSKRFAKTGQFACLYVQFVLVRKFAFYLTYTYLPSTLVLIISWLSFLLDSKAVPARISIGLLSVLALMTQSAATLQQLPRVSYIKAIDVWMFACLAFVVLSLLEFAIVNSIERRSCCGGPAQDKRRGRRGRSKRGGEEPCEQTTSLHSPRCPAGMEAEALVVEVLAEKGLAPVGRPAEDGHVARGGDNNGSGGGGPDARARASQEQRRDKRAARTARVVDKCCIVIFPVTFAFFNALYWTHFSPPEAQN